LSHSLLLSLSLSSLSLFLSLSFSHSLTHSLARALSLSLALSRLYQQALRYIYVCSSFKAMLVGLCYRCALNKNV
jgi:hypothetical protein